MFVFFWIFYDILIFLFRVWYFDIFLKFLMDVFVLFCRYVGKLRLGIVIELLRVIASLEEKFKDVSFFFFVFYGDVDVVIEFVVSSFLYESVKFEDKIIWIYEGMLYLFI